MGLSLRREGGRAFLEWNTAIVSIACKIRQKFKVNTVSFVVVFIKGKNLITSNKYKM